MARDATAAHSASWQFQTETHLNATVKSMTEYGPLTGFLELRAQSNNDDGSNNVVTAGTGGIASSTTRFAYLDSAYLELGMLLAGRTGSIYDYSGGFNWDWMDFDSDQGTDQVRLTWAMSGFGIQLAIEDPRDRWGTSLSGSYSMPDIVGNITMSQGHWSAQLSGGFAETGFGSGFGAQLATTIKLDQIAPGDQLLLKAAWAENQVWSFAAGTGRGRCYVGQRVERGCVVPALLGPDPVVGCHLAVLQPERWSASLRTPTRSSATWCGRRSPTSLLVSKLATARPTPPARATGA